MDLTSQYRNTAQFRSKMHRVVQEARECVHLIGEILFYKFASLW